MLLAGEEGPVRLVLATDRVAGLCRAALVCVERDIAANRREDGLYHTYNLLDVADDGSGVAVGSIPNAGSRLAFSAMRWASF